MVAVISMALRLLTGNFTRGVKEATGGLRSIGHQARQVSQMARQAGGAVLDHLATPGGLLGGIGLGVAAREIADFDLRLKRVQLSASATNQEAGQLRQRLLDLSGVKTGQLAGDLLTAVEVLTAAGVPLAAQSALIERLGKTGTATGSSMEDLANTAFQLQNAYNLSPEESIRGLEQLAVAGKKGQFEMKDMAAFLPQVGSTMAAMGQKGPQGLARTAAMLQIVRESTDDAGSAANNLINALGFIQSSEGAGKLGKAGVNVFDTNGQTRDLFELLDEIGNITDGGNNQKLMAGIFSDRQALAGMTALISKGEKLRTMTDGLENSGSIIDKDAAAIATTTAQQIKNLRADLERIAAVQLGPWIERMGDVAKFFTQHENLTATLAKGTVALMGLAAARKMGKGLTDWARGAGGKGSKGAGALGTTTGVGATPVQVVNWPGGGFGGMTNTGVGGGKTSRMGTALQWAGGAALALDVGVALGTVINEAVLSDTFKEGMQNKMAQTLNALRLGSADTQRMMGMTPQQEAASLARLQGGDRIIRGGTSDTIEQAAVAAAKARREERLHLNITLRHPDGTQQRLTEARVMRRG